MALHNSFSTRQSAQTVLPIMLWGMRIISLPRISVLAYLAGCDACCLPPGYKLISVMVTMTPCLSNFALRDAPGFL